MHYNDFDCPDRYEEKYIAEVEYDQEMKISTNGDYVLYSKYMELYVKYEALVKVTEDSSDILKDAVKDAFRS